MKTVLDAVLQPNLHTKKIVHPPPESTKLSLDDVDDICFVCNEGGEVVLCDYPYCPKVYHQVLLQTICAVCWIRILCGCGVLGFLWMFGLLSRFSFIFLFFFSDFSSLVDSLLIFFLLL